MNVVTLELERFAHTEDATFGRLLAPSFSCFTVERPWLENRRFVSCIPPGEYPLERTRYWRGGYETFEIADVPDRSRILIHRGNRATDVQGCIAVGRRLGCLSGEWAILDSRAAFDDLFGALRAARDSFEDERAGDTAYSRVRYSIRVSNFLP